MHASSDFVIETDGLTKTYPGPRSKAKRDNGTPALKGLSMQVHKNSIFAFLGPNGAGKTTTIKLLLGLAKPTAGSARVFGLDIGRNSVEIRKRVGYLAQDPRYYEYMSAREIMRFTARFFYRGPGSAIEKRIDETLELVGLANKADRPIKGFSGGERQRLGIGQAQVNYPDLLILDEPAASLDPQGRHDVLAVMERLRKHTTIFYSTHILSDVQRVSDTVLILNHGELIAQAPIEQLLSGGQGPAYSLLVKGDAATAQTRLEGVPWIRSIQATPGDGHTHWQVTVSDDATAEVQLLPSVLAGGEVVVLEYGRKKADLEEIFLGLTEGGQHGKR